MLIVMVIIVVIVLVLTRVMPLAVLDVGLGGDAFQVSLELAVPLLLRKRTDLHVDVSTGHLRLLIHMPHVVQVFFDPLGKLMTKLLVGHLTSFELELNAHLVSFSQEVLRMKDFDMIVVRVDADTELQFLHLATLLMLVGFLLVLLLKVFVFAVIDDLADRGFSVRGDLDKIKTPFTRHTDRLCRGQHTIHVIRYTIDHADLRRTDTLVNAGLIDIAAIVWTWPPILPDRRTTGLKTRTRANSCRWRTGRPWCPRRTWAHRARSTRRTCALSWTWG